MRNGSNGARFRKPSRSSSGMVFLPRSTPSPHDLLDDMSVDVCQTAVDAVVADRQLLMVDAQQVQDGRVDVVAVGRLVDRLVRPLVASPVGHASLDAPAAEPVGERERVVVAALRTLAA